MGPDGAGREKEETEKNKEKSVVRHPVQEPEHQSSFVKLNKEQGSAAAATATATTSASSRGRSRGCRKLGAGGAGHCTGKR